MLIAVAAVNEAGDAAGTELVVATAVVVVDVLTAVLVDVEEVVVGCCP